MKRLIALVVFVVLLAVALCGCANASDHKTQYVGIISAMDNEIAALLKEAKIDRVDTYGGVAYHVGKLRGKSVVISRSGIGKIRASAGVTTMLNCYNVSNVIFTGIAGGVADQTQVMDEIIATRLVEHDYGIVTNDGFEWTSGDPGMGPKPGEYYECDTKLVDLAYAAAVEVVGSDHVFKGTIATGDQFIASEDYVQRLKTQYDAYACEMEGAAAAVVCIKYGKPFVVLRALSDKADGNAHESYEGFGDVAASNSGNIVLKMLESMK